MTDCAHTDHSAPMQAPDLPHWALVLRSPTGSTKPKSVPRRELYAVAAWIAQLEAAMADPPSPSDHYVLGSIGRHTLLNLRLAREVFRATKTKGGEIKVSVGELRQSTRFVVDLLGKLRFKSSRVPKGPDMRDTWSAT